MLSTIKALPKLAAALAVAGALTFGATQALAHDECTPLPPHTCNDKGNPNQWCNAFCIDPGGYFGGGCNAEFDCCACLEK